MTQTIHSVLGIGFGPANLSLAVALEELGFRGDCRFIERTPGFQWQEELLLPGTDIQNHPFRDLVMPRNLHSPHTFVNYLATCGRLTDHLHLNVKFPLRRDYAGYLRWVADAFQHCVDYAQRAVGLALIRNGEDFVFRVETEDGRQYLGQTVVLGTGRTPRVPAEFQGSLGSTVFHSSRYLSSIGRLAGRDLRVVVVGASQSAIEIVLDLLGRDSVAQVVSVQRGIGFRLKDTSPYSRRAFLPEFVDYFHPLPNEVKRRLRAELRSINYGACDQDVIDQLARLENEYELLGRDRFRLLAFSRVTAIAPVSGGRGHRLTVGDVNHGTEQAVEADAVVLATGYRDFGIGPEDELRHHLLDGVQDVLVVDDQGLPVVARDYSLRLRHLDRPRLYLNGLCEASHGMGDSGALAVLSARSTDIAGSITSHSDAAERRPPVAVQAGP